MFSTRIIIFRLFFHISSLYESFDESLNNSYHVCSLITNSDYLFRLGGFLHHNKQCFGISIKKKLLKSIHMLPLKQIINNLIQTMNRIIAPVLSPFFLVYFFVSTVCRRTNCEIYQMFEFDMMNNWIRGLCIVISSIGVHLVYIYTNDSIAGSNYFRYSIRFKWQYSNETWDYFALRTWTVALFLALWFIDKWQHLTTLSHVNFFENEFLVFFNGFLIRAFFFH